MFSIVCDLVIECMAKFVEAIVDNTINSLFECFELNLTNNKSNEMLIKPVLNEIRSNRKPEKLW